MTERSRSLFGSDFLAPGPEYLVAGRYRLKSKLGGGGMGAVWLAHDRLLDRKVAIKQVLSTAGLSEAEANKVREHIVHEGRVAAKLRHQHAIAVYDVVLEAGEPWLVMEFVPARSLAQAIALINLVPAIEVAQVGAQVADALAAAHAVGIVHRDIKPGNILVADRGAEVGIAKLSDFGISRGASDLVEEADDVITGTPAYLPPEVARGMAPTAASDVFSLGATLYTAIEGQPPYGFDDDQDAIVERAAMGQIIAPTRSDPLTKVLLHMMEPAPQRRPTMAEARDEILAAAFGPGTGPQIVGAPVRGLDGSLPVWAAHNSTNGVPLPRFAPLPRPAPPGLSPQRKPARKSGFGLEDLKFGLADLSPNTVSVAIGAGVLIGALIVVGLLVAIM